MTPAIFAVDGGNSKADVALVAIDGTLLSVLRGPPISHQAVGLERGLDNLETSAGRALRLAGLDAGRRPVSPLGVYALAGADLPSDIRLLDRGLRGRGLTDELVLLNDTHAALRAGSDRPWGVVVVCGAGINGQGSARRAGSSGLPVSVSTPAIAAVGATSAGRRWPRRSGDATVAVPGRAWRSWSRPTLASSAPTP